MCNIFNGPMISEEIGNYIVDAIHVMCFGTICKILMDIIITGKNGNVFFIWAIVCSHGRNKARV